MRASRFFVLALALIALAPGCATKKLSEIQRAQAQVAYEQGIEFLGKREWAAALTALQRATTLNPGMAVYRNGYGVVQLHAGRLDQALAEFQRAAELDPAYAEAHLNTGIALAELKRWPEAVAAYEKAIALPRLQTPDTAHHNLGIALFHLKRYQEAENAFRFAVNLDPEMQAGWYHLGFALAAMRKLDDAKTSFRKARDLGPTSPIGQAATEHLKALGDGG